MMVTINDAYEQILPLLSDEISIQQLYSSVKLYCLPIMFLFIRAELNHWMGLSGACVSHSHQNSLCQSISLCDYCQDVKRLSTNNKKSSESK